MSLRDLRPPLSWIGVAGLLAFAACEDCNGTAPDPAPPPEAPIASFTPPTPPTVPGDEPVRLAEVSRARGVQILGGQVYTMRPLGNRAVLVRVAPDGSAIADVASLGDAYFRAVLGDRIFVANQTDEPGLDSVPAAGGAPTRLTTHDPRAVAVGDPYLYLAAFDPDRGFVVERMGRDGGGAWVVYDGLHAMRDIALRGDRLYWVARRPVRGGNREPGLLAHAPAGGGGPIEEEVFLTQRPVEVEVDDDAVFLLTEGTEGGGGSDGMVLRRPHGETEWAVLAAGQPTPSMLRQDGSRLCWKVADAGGAVHCVPKAGGPVRVYPTPALVSGLDLQGGRIVFSSALAGVVLGVVGAGQAQDSP